MRSAFALVVVAGCGRIAFDPLTDGSGIGADISGACDDPCALDPAPVDETFDLADGPLSTPWIGEPNAFRIVAGEVEPYGYGTNLRGDIHGDAAQWAQITFTALAPQEFGLTLRAQTLDMNADRISVSYHHEPPTSHIHIGTAVGGGWVGFTQHPIELSVGTRLRAVARSGVISAYANETLIISEAAPLWTLGDAPGYIGLYSWYLQTGAKFDNFGGGTCGCR